MDRIDWFRLTNFEVSNSVQWSNVAHCSFCEISETEKCLIEWSSLFVCLFEQNRNVNYSLFFKYPSIEMTCRVLPERNTKIFINGCAFQISKFQRYVPNPISSAKMPLMPSFRSLFNQFKPSIWWLCIFPWMYVGVSNTELKFSDTGAWIGFIVLIPSSLICILLNFITGWHLLAVELKFFDAGDWRFAALLPSSLTWILLNFITGRHLSVELIFSGTRQFAILRFIIFESTCTTYTTSVCRLR